MSLRLLIFTICLIPEHFRIRCDDDPGLVYVPVGPTSDFRVKGSDPGGDAAAQNASLTSTLSPFGKNFSLSRARARARARTWARSNAKARARDVARARARARAWGFVISF